MGFLTNKLWNIKTCKMKVILNIVFVGFLLFILSMGFLCCEEHHPKSGRKLLFLSQGRGNNYHEKLHENIDVHLKSKQDSKYETFTAYEYRNKDVAVNTLPKPHRTRKKRLRKKQRWKAVPHQTPPMIIGDQGNLVTGAINNQHYY